MFVRIVMDPHQHERVELCVSPSHILVASAVVCVELAEIEASLMTT